MGRGGRKPDLRKRLLHLGRSLRRRGLRQCSPERLQRIELTKGDIFSKDISRRKEDIIKIERNKKETSRIS